MTTNTSKPSENEKWLRHHADWRRWSGSLEQAERLERCADELASLRSRLAAVEKENAKLRSQLPSQMQDCSIRFSECGVGHGWLTAENWIQRDCPTCREHALRSERDELRVRIANINAEAERRVDAVVAEREALRAENEHLLIGRNNERARADGLAERLAALEKQLVNADAAIAQLSDSDAPY